MGLRSAQRGYRYQDFIAGLVFCWSLLQYQNPYYIIDEKDNKDDWIEDIKVVCGNKKDCFQIKYTEKRKLSVDDFKSNGELSLDILLKYFLVQKEYDIRFFLLLKWSKPTDGLKDLLVEDNNQLFDFPESAFYCFDLNKIEKICLTFGLNNNCETNELLSKIHIVCEMPESSLDFLNPLPLETYLFNSIEKIGIGVFPNNNITLEQFAKNLFVEMDYYRTSKVFKVESSTLLSRLCVCTDFGKLNEIPSLNENMLVRNVPFLDEVINALSTFERVVVVGEPGSGKTHLCFELERYLSEQSIKYTKHYLYVGTADAELAKRTDTNYLISNLLATIYKLFPNLNKDNSLFGADIKCLNKAIDLIDEQIFLIIDGVDHAYRNYGEKSKTDLIDLINDIHTNKFVHILLITQPMDCLKNLKHFTSLQMPKWTQREIMILASHKNINPTTDQLKLLVEKGEGNPLYINYLLDNITQINDAPQYGGNITNYYRYLLKSIESPYLCKYLVSIPFFFSEKEFSVISNSGSDGDAFIGSISFLLKYDNLAQGYKIYHESFIRFLYDYCVEKRIDLKLAKRDVVNYLKTLNFYSNFKCYNYYLSLLKDIDDYESILAFASYDFLENSVYYGHTIHEIRENLNLFRIGACHIHSYYYYCSYLLLKKCVDNYYDQDYVGGDYPDYYLAFLSLFGEDGLNKLFLHKCSPNTSNLIYYSAFLDGLNPSSSLISENGDYSPFERNYYLTDLVAERYQNGETIKNIKSEATFDQKLEIIRAMNELGKVADVTNSNDNEVLSILSCYRFDGIGGLNKNTINLSFIPNVYKENFGSILANFVLNVNNGLLTSEQEKNVKKQQDTSFIYSVFRLVIDNNSSYVVYKSNNKDLLLEKSLINNLLRFKNRVDPFIGDPRACDFTSVSFKYIFITLLLTPLKYLINRYQDYLVLLFEIKNKLETTVRGSVLSCISLDDILENIGPFLNENNRESVLDALMAEVEKSLPNYLYAYSAGFCFKMSRLYKTVNENKQKELFLRGVRYSLAYGNHKDIFFEELLGSLDYSYDLIGNSLEISALVGNMAQGLDSHTDGRETKWFYVDWIRTIANKNISGVVNYLSDYSLKNGYFWKNDIGMGVAIESLYKSISSSTLFWLLISNQLEYNRFDYDIYLFCIKKLHSEGNLDYAEQLINYLYSINKEFESDANLIANLNDFVSKNGIASKRFITREERENGSNKDSILETISTHLSGNDESIDQTQIIAKRITDCGSLDSDEKKHLVIDSIINNRHTIKLDKLYDYLLSNEWNEEDVVFLNAVFFFFKRDGWYKSFIDSNCFIKGYCANKELFNKTFFSLAEQQDDVWRGVCELGSALFKAENEKEQALQIYDLIYFLTQKRVPDCRDFIKKESLTTTLTIEELSIALVLSRINEYGADNHKTILRFVASKIQNNDKFVIKWLFSNWNYFKTFVKCELIALLLKYQFNFKLFSKEVVELSVNDSTYITKTFFAGIVQNAKHNEPILIKAMFPKNNEAFYCCLHLYNFYLVDNFCFLHGLDSSELLELYKHSVNNEDIKHEYSLFYSPSSNRPIENYYRYNLYLESVNSFFEKHADEIALEDFLGVLNKLLPVEDELTTNCFLEADKFKNGFVPVSSYISIENDKGFKKPIRDLNIQKSITIEEQFLNSKDSLSINNIEKIGKSICRDYQILFTFSPTITNKYKIRSEERDGMMCYFVDEKMIGFYHIQKESIKGIESYYDRYYLKETGTLYIKKKFLNMIKKDFGVSRLVKKKTIIECNYCV